MRLLIFLPMFRITGVRFYTSGSERYARIEVKWSSEGISEFNASNDTYEQELVFYNYDNKAYTTYCSAYQTNIPDPYLDTQIQDTPEEANLAIGTTAANEIQHNTTYYFIYNLKGSNAIGSMYKVGCQEGYYVVLPSTYITFAESTTHVITFKSGCTAPETRNWYTEVEPNGTMNFADTRYSDAWLSVTLSSTSDVDYERMQLSGTKSIRFISPSGG